MCYKRNIELTSHQNLSSDPLLITTYRINLKERDTGWEHEEDSYSHSCSTFIRQLHSVKGVSPKVVSYVNYIDIIIYIPL